MSEKVVFIKTPVSILRPILESDIPAMLRWVNDPELRPFVSSVIPQMEANEQEWVKALSKRQTEMKDLVFIIESPDGQAIGTMGLHAINMKDRFATTGAMIGEKVFWGKGIGSETKMHLLNYGFNELNLDRINSRVIEYNERSLSYSKRCGYQVEGRLRSVFFKNGRYWDEIVLGVLKSDFQPIWEEYQRTGKLK